MIAQLIAAVKAAKDRPARPWTVIAGGFLVGAGIALVQRYANQLAELVDQDEKHYADLTQKAELAAAEYSKARARLAAVRQEEWLAQTAEPDAVKAVPPGIAVYPSRDDLDPLRRGDQAAEVTDTP